MDRPLSVAALRCRTSDSSAGGARAAVTAFEAPEEAAERNRRTALVASIVHALAP